MAQTITYSSREFRAKMAQAFDEVEAGNQVVVIRSNEIFIISKGAIQLKAEGQDK